mmetsp:Transcript_18316/g.55298  ORF Transcript_18316/g.55298 Transcript_18316/m.55298 type:complete len:292 (+) Transcript_18316:684-1559(+)
MVSACAFSTTDRSLTAFRRPALEVCSSPPSPSIPAKEVRSEMNLLASVSLASLAISSLLGIMCAIAAFIAASGSLAAFSECDGGQATLLPSAPLGCRTPASTSLRSFFSIFGSDIASWAALASLEIRARVSFMTGSASISRTSRLNFCPPVPGLSACAAMALRCSSSLAVRVSTTPTRFRSPLGIQPSGSPAPSGCIPSSEPFGYNDILAFLKKPFLITGLLLPLVPSWLSTSSILGAGLLFMPTLARFDRHGPGAAASSSSLRRATFICCKRFNSSIGIGVARLSPTPPL